MPKSEFPKSVQNLPKNKYEKWTSVYHSARDGGDSKETAAKKAWGVIKKETLSLPWSNLKEVLSDEAVGPSELKLYIDSDGELYRAHKKPIMKNLARKMIRGVYNSDKAIKLWMYFVEGGAKKYVKEFGAPNEEWSNVFPKNERWLVAKELSDEFEDDVRSGELDVDELAGYTKKEGLEEETSMFFGQNDSNSERISELENLMTENGLSYREMLEDVIGVLDEVLFASVLKSLRKKYGYKG